MLEYVNSKNMAQRVMKNYRDFKIHFENVCTADNLYNKVMISKHIE